MKKVIFSLAALGVIFTGCSQKAGLVVTSTDYVEEANSKLKTVYFDFDKSFIRDDQWGTVISNSNVLNDGKIQSHSFLIEGHCDEWGSDEYNYALGLKRAKSTKDTMVKEGFVNPERIHIASKGESEPVCQTHTKDCDALNRRTEITIYPINQDR